MVTSPTEQGALMRELGDIQKAIGRLEGAMTTHEKADEDRHEQLCDRLDKIENRAEDTGRQEVARVQSRADRLEADAKAAAAATAAKAESDALALRNARRALVEKIVVAVVGALLAIATGAGAHALGWR